MQQHEFVESILDALAELATLHAAAAAAAERAWSALSECNLAGPSTSDHARRRRSTSRPWVNAATFTVEWRGRHCDLGPTILFKLIQHLSHRPDYYYPYDLLMAEVWRRRCSDTTIRCAFKRLRRALSEAGMDDLAGAIKGRGQCYGLFLNGDGLRKMPQKCHRNAP